LRFAVGFVALACAMAGQEPKAPPLMDCVCVRASGPITVDGTINEAAWQHARPISEFRVWKTLDPPTESTSVRFLFDDSNLYAFFDCADADIAVVHEGRDSFIWESDCVELFLWPDQTKPIYYEFEVSPNNDVFDGRFVNTGSGAFRRWAKWDCPIRTAVQFRGTVNDWTDKDKGYSVELAIPLDALAESIGNKSLTDQAWKFAAVRVDVSATLESEERSSTANIRTGDIHKEKDGYFTLRFVDQER